MQKFNMTKLDQKQCQSCSGFKTQGKTRARTLIRIVIEYQMRLTVIRIAIITKFVTTQIRLVTRQFHKGIENRKKRGKENEIDNA